MNRRTRAEITRATFNVPASAAACRKTAPSGASPLCISPSFSFSLPFPARFPSTLAHSEQMLRRDRRRSDYAISLRCPRSGVSPHPLSLSLSLSLSLCAPAFARCHVKNLHARIRACFRTSVDEEGRPLNRLTARAGKRSVLTAEFTVNARTASQPNEAA